MARKTKLLSSFSPRMMKDKTSLVQFEKLEIEEGDLDFSKVQSFIGNREIANYLDVPCRRGNIILEKGDEVIVANISGGEIRNGELPEGGFVSFVRCTFL